MLLISCSYLFSPLGGASHHQMSYCTCSGVNDDWSRFSMKWSNVSSSVYCVITVFDLRLSHIEKHIRHLVSTLFLFNCQGHIGIAGQSASLLKCLSLRIATLNVHVVYIWRWLFLKGLVKGIISSQWWRFLSSPNVKTRKERWSRRMF